MSCQILGVIEVSNLPQKFSPQVNQPRFEGSGPYSSVPPHFPSLSQKFSSSPQNYPPFYQTQGNNAPPRITGEGTRNPGGAQGHNSDGFRKENRKCFYCGISGHL